MAHERVNRDDDGSDTASLDALVSPRDGYFGAPPVPDELYIPDPAQQNTAAAKEREALEELQQHPDLQHQQQHPQQQTRVPSGVPSGSRDRTLLPDGSSAPWASPPRPTSPVSVVSQSNASDIDTHHHHHHHNNRNPSRTAHERSSMTPASPPAYAEAVNSTNTSYGTLPRPHTMVQPSAYFPSHQPQDLGGADTPLLGDERPPRRSAWRTVWSDGNTVGKRLVIVCSVLLVLVFVSKTVSQMFRSQDRSSPGGDAPHPPPAWEHCRQATYTDSHELGLDSTERFSFSQHNQRPDGSGHFHHVQISGSVSVRKSSSQDRKVVISAEYRSNSKDVIERTVLRTATKTEAFDGPLELWVPQYTEEWETDWNRPCIDLGVVLTVREDVDFETFNVGTEVISVNFEDVSYSGSETTVTTNLGSISFSNGHAVKSRKIIIDADNGSVQGSFPLYDLLRIKTGSGSVKINLQPHKADHRERPAELQIEANSGSVEVSTNLNELPPRVYQTQIRTDTGSIAAQPLVHGSFTKLYAQSGSITGTLHPVGPLDEASLVSAKARIGAVHLALAPHLDSPQEPMRNLSAYYESQTGHVGATHPQQWEGVVRGDAKIGKVHVDWPGLRKIEHGGKGWIGDHFKGKKGQGDATLVASSNTGSIDLKGEDVA